MHRCFPSKLASVQPKHPFLPQEVSALLIFGGTIPALIWADSWGRRQSTIFGGIGLGIAMFLIGGLYAAHSVHGSHGAECWIVIVSRYISLLSSTLCPGVWVSRYTPPKSSPSALARQPQAWHTEAIGVPTSWLH